MELSLYTLFVEKDNKYYLYNSETEFLSLVPEDIYEKLHDGAYDDIEKDVIDQYSVNFYAASASKLNISLILSLFNVVFGFFSNTSIIRCT